ncbi:MAG: hypothetical protein EKK64_10300 [Neisseriaceae bacterium]|nr:MAG: hypothetical protein EKK64_10300 [Neisseriaceae bacterium]
MKSTKKQFSPIEFGEMLHHVQNYGINWTNREIYLHSHYSSTEEEGIEYRMATQFIKNLHLLNSINDKKITVHLQTPGGDWNHGIAMFDAVVFSKSPISMIAYGEINSMSGIFFQSAKERIMMPNCSLMIHKGFLALEGNTNAIHSNAMFSRRTDLSMLKIFAEKAVGSPFFKEKKMNVKQIESYIDKKISRVGDWNLTSEESVYYGFADKIFDGKN